MRDAFGRSALHPQSWEDSLLRGRRTCGRSHACDVLKRSEMFTLMRKVKAVQRAILDLRSAGGMALLLLDSCRRKIFRIGSGPFDSSCHHTTAAAPSTAVQIMATKTFQSMARNQTLASNARRNA